MVDHVPLMVLCFGKLKGYSKHVLDASEPENGFSGRWYVNTPVFMCHWKL